MYLKRLDVIGFKSFADRVSIDFVEGVTAVVGPNGSGKSNITDAIRWVLGEQSAKSLRGTKMEDIIFSGSDSRRSLNFAEVTLTLDNEDAFLPLDYNEVSITRRVFRSGESDFLINKQSCRLKDIIDLFMDSGLGREAFSIISQGKVEQILNSKAEERRTIFEEAAGVLKYKNRKRKAELKLEETQENLNRVQDILYELESQVEPLKIQASMAKDYLEQKEELEKFEVALTVHDIEELHQKWKNLESILQKNRINEMDLSNEITTKDANLEKLRDHVAALDESISDLQNVLLYTSEELEKLEGRKEVLKERKKNAVQNKDQLIKIIEELQVKIEVLRDHQLQMELAEKAQFTEVEELKANLKAKRNELLHFQENIEEKIELLKSEYIELLNQEAAAKNEVQYIQQQMEQISFKTDKFKKENHKYLQERIDLEKIEKELINKLESATTQLTNHVHLFRNEEKKLENLKSSYQKQESILYQAYQYLQKTRSRKEMLESMEDEFTGFFQGVKEILKARNNQLQGIEGAVLELIQVDKMFETAIETALGAAAQHIIVQTEEHGRAAIQFLKKNAYGRATLLPLSVIKGKTLPQSNVQLLKDQPSFIGIASDLINYDSKYSSVMTNLLGTVIVTKDLKSANELAKILQYRNRIVTLEGDVVNPGGSMTGGALKQKTTSILSRKNDLEEVKVKLVEMETKTTELENHVKKIKQSVQQKEVLISELRKKGEELRLKEHSYKAERRECELNRKNINEKLSIYDLDQKQLQEETEHLMVRLEERKNALIEARNQIDRLDEQINNLSNKRQSEIISKEELTMDINSMNIELAKKTEQLSYLKERHSSILEEFHDTERKLKEHKEDFHLLSSEMSSSSTGEKQLEEAATRKQLDKEETIRLISSRREERMKLYTKLEDLELDVKEKKRQYKGLTEILKDEEVKLNRVDVELENKLNFLQVEYSLTYEGAKEQIQLAIPIDEARKKVKLIKLSIEEMGNVNLGAIDEYTRVSERYEFLLEQKTDLQNAKETLYQVIEEMDVEMKRKFEQTFTAIRSQFESVFQALFGGGRADLRLTNPNNLLETGVEIVAQPPGKKLQNLGLLSGGERALTAIALLFSILKVRPVPFCVLDEVEAALDEANVFRFSQYLKRYSAETQFIVITHRKGTMEEADVLYGVTMQESGVSKLVSVRLEETKS